MRVGKEPASQGGGGSGLKGHHPACFAISGHLPKSRSTGAQGTRNPDWCVYWVISVIATPLHPARGNHFPLYEDLAGLH